MAHALHHLWIPHCERCESLQRRANELSHEQALELRVCHSCETLKSQLEFQNLLIRELTHKSETEIVNTGEFKPIAPKHIPWAVRRAQLEREDRELAARLRMEKNKEITENDLDAELESLGKDNG